MDRLEQTVEHERQIAQRGSEAAPEDADYNHPALKPIHDKMVSSHQRRMQQLASKEKELDRQMQMLQAMQQQQGQQYSAGSQQSAPVASDEFDWLEPEVKPLLGDPQGGAQFRALLRSIDKRAQKAAPPETLSKYEHTLTQLQQQLAATQQQVMQERFARQIPAFGEKYGKLLDEDQQRQVLERAWQTGEELERALFATHPEVALARERAAIKAELQQQFQHEYGAQLEGMEDIVSSTPRPNASPVDSTGKLVDFRQTAMEVLGKGGMVSAIRNGMSREEPVQSEG